MAKKISVIIPNYNGADLLNKNLPNVIKFCPGAEIIIVDDASEDESVNIIKKNFKKIRTIVNSKNMGFGKTVNRGVSASKGDLVLLLNSDVSPKTDLLGLTKHFDDEEVFAVGLLDKSHENGKVVEKGRGGANFQKGFLNHFALKTVSGDTLWVSGGSGIFDKDKFLKLGGFDPDYAPFYWEDIDLCYRAQKAGFKCFFDTGFVVDHFHESGAIKKSKSESYVKGIAYKNQFLFVWKNIDDYFLLTQHLLWFPYHCVNALRRKDWAFFYGFTRALFELPAIVFNYQQLYYKSKLKDTEIISKYGK